MQPMRRIYVGLLAFAVLGCQAERVEVAHVPVHEVAQAGDFMLTLASAQTEYIAGEPMQIEATLTYVGASPVVDVHASRDIFGWGFARLDGPGQDERSPVLMCASWTMSPDETVSSFVPIDAQLAATPGTWRIWATTLVGAEQRPDVACPTDTRLSAEIVITTR